MKRLISMLDGHLMYSVAIFIIIACIFLATSCAIMQPHRVQVTQAANSDYSYEGMVDPKVVIETWTQMKDETIRMNQYWWEVYYQNPDKDSRILVVCTLRYINGFCKAYSYIYNGELYCFFRNKEDCFKLYDWTNQEEQKRLLKQRLLNALDGANV